MLLHGVAVHCSTTKYQKCHSIGNSSNAFCLVINEININLLNFNWMQLFWLQNRCFVLLQQKYEYILFGHFHRINWRHFCSRTHSWKIAQTFYFLISSAFLKHKTCIAGLRSIDSISNVQSTIVSRCDCILWSLTFIERLISDYAELPSII